MSFQGKQVHASKVQLTGGAKEVLDDVPQIDEIVEVTIEGRVTGVDFRVDDKTGDLIKNVRVKVLEVGDIKTLSVPQGVSSPADPSVRTLGDGRIVNTETGQVTMPGEVA